RAWVRLPPLATLLDGAREPRLPLADRFRQLVGVAEDRPRRALLHEREQLVHLLFLPRNRRGTAVAGDDRLVRLARGDEVHTVLGDHLVAPQHIAKPQNVEPEESRADQVFVAAPPAAAALHRWIVELALGLDR